MSSFIERMVAEADGELQRINGELDVVRDGLNRAIAIATELQRRQAVLSSEYAEVIRVLAAVKGPSDPTPDPIDVPVIDKSTGQAIELGTVEGVTPVEPGGGEPSSAEEAVAASEPTTNGHAGTEELESSRNGRKTHQRVSLAAVRNFCVSQPDKFGTADVAEALGISRSTAKKYVDQLVTHKPPILEQHGTVGRYVRYSYIPPQKGAGPTHRPRHEREVMAKAGVRIGSRAKGDRAVPHTGRMIGPSGKPGRDKKLAEQGKRVKRHRQGT